MSLNQNELAYLTRLLNAQLIDGAVQKVHQPREKLFVLECFGGGCGRARLVIDLTRGAPSCYLTPTKIKNPESPTALCTLLRKHLTNGRIRSVEALEHDRIWFIDLDKMTDDGPRRRRLVLEFIPGYPVLFLLDETGTILAASQAVRNQQRDLGRGDTWTAPPFAGGTRNETLFEAFPGWTEENIFELLEAAGEPATQTIDRLALKKEAARAVKRQRKKVNKIEADLRRLTESEDNADLGELLKSALHEIEPGMTEIRVRDWGVEGEVYRTISLDPSLSAQDNLELLFKKAKKSQRGREAAQERLDEQRALLRRFTRLEEALEDKKADTEELAAEARALGLVVEEKTVQPAKKKIEQPRRKPYKTYVSRDGIEIRVGRGSSDNDELTFKHCKGNEWWFHADGYPGSHVVAKTSDELPQETLIDAATLAVEFSKAASGGKQAVSYTRRKNVSKYKGARPGQVILRTHKTILVMFESNRLERLKKSMPGSTG